MNSWKGNDPKTVTNLRLFEVLSMGFKFTTSKLP